MSSYSQPPRRARKRHRPIARVTSYDINVKYDLRRKMSTKRDRSGAEGLFAAPIHEEAYDVMEGETLVSIDKSQAYRDGDVHCFSFANGLGADIPSDMKEKIVAGGEQGDIARLLARYMILDKLQLVGVAVTNFDASRNSHQDMMQGFVANVGGLNTIVNTSDGEIRPGDYITVDLPKHWKFEDDAFSKHKKQEGIPLDKILFSTSVYDPQSAGRDAANLISAAQAYNGSLLGSQVPSVLRTAKSLKDKSIDTSKKLELMAISKLVLEVNFLKKRFILGKALSFARPGEPFDIVLSGCPSL